MIKIKSHEEIIEEAIRFLEFRRSEILFSIRRHRDHFACVSQIKDKYSFIKFTFPDELYPGWGEYYFDTSDYPHNLSHKVVGVLHVYNYPDSRQWEASLLMEHRDRIEKLYPDWFPVRNNQGSKVYRWML